ncbi:hypothetical protein L1047_03945 [Synechococcus sp. Nb3U1]|uniref:hypothetical protein n=1 Tax=Synechococcus sp. Nb3U1 TaxID=1914529 RepID=UPI001F3A5E6C|nr:hypothetical protein [Synechococcus sp. Nb3U1]MCF2970347.1 hypothetical protein [Synechococcus sp. Nb3U1]
MYTLPGKLARQLDGSQWGSLWAVAWRWGVLLALVCVLGSSGCSGQSESTAPPLVPPPPQLGAESIPMPVRTLGNSRFKLLGLNVGVAGGSAELLLDTGSAGLRIVSSAVGAFGLERTTTPSTVTFGDGTQFIGVLARAPFSLGGIQSREPVTVQLIDQITCVDALVGGCSETLFGEGRPFAGILGTALDERSADREVFSPLTRLPGNFRSGYIIQTGGFESPQGIFTVGLTDANTAGFNFRQFPQVGTFPDGTPIWRDEALQAAYTISNTSIQNVLSPTNFDSGSSDIFLNVSLLGAAPFSTSTLPAGAEWRAVLEGAFDYRIRVGFPVTPSRDRIFVNGLLNKQLLGMPLFFNADIAFDIERGRVGFRLR